MSKGKLKITSKPAVQPANEGVVGMPAKARAKEKSPATPTLKQDAQQENGHAVDPNAPVGTTNITALLPSRMAVYPEDVAYLRPYSVKELLRLGTVNLAQSIRPVLEAIGACTNLNMSTMARIDMWTMAYWLRLNSFKRTPFVVSWDCEHIEHYAQVRRGSLPESSLKNETILEQSDLRVNYLDVDRLQELHNQLSEFGIALSLETMQSWLESEQTGDRLGEMEKSLIPYASHLHTKHGATLVDRINFLQQADYSPEVLELLHQVIQLEAASGPVETIKVKCEVCRQEAVVPIGTSLTAFFPLSV